MHITAGMMVAELRDRFDRAGVPDPQLDARLLVSSLLDISLTDLTLNPDRGLSADDVRRVRAAGDRRCRREPVHRILGRRAFHALETGQPYLFLDNVKVRPWGGRRGRRGGGAQNAALLDVNFDLMGYLMSSAQAGNST